MYFLNAVISLLFGFCLLLPFMNSKIDYYLTKNNKGTDLWDDPVQVKLFVAAILACLYILATTIIIIIQLSHSRNHNVFIFIRFAYYLLVLGLFFNYIVLVCVLNTEKKEESGEGHVQETCCTYLSLCCTHLSHLCCTHLSLSVINLLPLALILLSLSVFPTLLLLFAYPENTFALIVIHVALFYTETVIGAYVIERLNRFTQRYLCTCSCCTSNTICCDRLRKTRDGYDQLAGSDSSTSTNTNDGPLPEIDSTTSQSHAAAETSVQLPAVTTVISCYQRDQEPSAKPLEVQNSSEFKNGKDLQLPTKVKDNQPQDKEKNEKERMQQDTVNTCSCSRNCLLFCGIIALVTVLVSVYFSLVWLYQFLILRNASSNEAFDMIVKYIPSVAIAALGFLVSKTNNQETVNGKNARRWLKLGELLDMDMSEDDPQKENGLDENKKNQIKCLQKVFKHDELLNKLTELQQTIENRFERTT